jgi:hypothetical protein
MLLLLVEECAGRRVVCLLFVAPGHHLASSAGHHFMHQLAPKATGFPVSLINVERSVNITLCLRLFKGAELTHTAACG